VWMVTVRPAAPADVEAITAIYNEGIEDRVATFETRPRGPDEVFSWLDDDLPLLVAAEDGPVLGFARVSPYSDRCVYDGEVGIQRRHGRLDGEWKDCVLVERLLGDAAHIDTPGV
jgi:hypothetical protein